MLIEPRDALAQVAEQYVGVHEEGDNSGPLVESFQRAVDGKAEREPWCLAFCFFCLDQVTEHSGICSGLYRTESVMLLWAKTPKQWIRQKPAKGLIAIWQERRNSRLGHAGIVVATQSGGKLFWTVEGNTSPSSEVDRQGDGVYRKLRKGYSVPGSQMILLGFLDPFTQDQ